MRIGLIAGSGRFPVLVLDAARQLGHDVTVIAIEGEAGAEIEAAAGRHPGVRLERVRLGEIGRAIALLRGDAAEGVLMAGRVAHARLFGDLPPDPLLARALAALPARNTDALIAGVAAIFTEHGLPVLDSTVFLAPLLAPAGVLTRRAPDPDEQADLAFGYGVADVVAGLDVGQTIVVKGRAVVAVEAMEGTDETIARAGRIAGPGTRVVKVAKPNQDMRFDVPIVGRSTIETMAAVGASALSIDAGRALVFDREAMIRLADQAGLTIVGRARD